MKKVLFLIAAIAMFATTAHAQSYNWNDDATVDGAVSIRVDVAKQMLYVYRGGYLIGSSHISTGREGHRTPEGSFPILMKDADHHSNLYNNAGMPFTERLTIDGVSLHAGNTSAESHGCVHLPLEFAKKLFSITHVGDIVTIEHGSEFDLAFKDYSR